MRHGHQIVREGSTKRKKREKRETERERERKLASRAVLQKRNGFSVGWVGKEKEKSKICKSS